jgi:ankyrin repeat protein
MTAKNRNSERLTASEVLQRYKEEDLPAFCEIPLDNVNQVGNFGERPLHVASSRGKLEEIAALVEAGAEVNAPGDLGNTPLHEAVGQGNLEAVQFLLDHGASPSVQNEFGETPLDQARAAKRNAIVEVLESSKTGHA